MVLEQQSYEMYLIQLSSLLAMVIFLTHNNIPQCANVLTNPRTYIEQFKKIAQNKFKGENIPIGIDVVTGSLAGAIAGAVTTPLDVMKTLLQTQQTVKNKPVSGTVGLEAPVKHYSGIIDGMMWNYRNQGMAGLFRGIGPRVFWTSLQSAIMFVIYEQVLHLQAGLRERGEWPPTGFV